MRTTAPPAAQPAADTALGGPIALTRRPVRSSPSPSHRWPIGRPLAIYAASRLLVLAAVAAADLIPPTSGWLGALGRWDGSWYLRIASHGYPHSVNAVQGAPGQNAIAFFPLFPLLIRAVHHVLPLDWSAEVAVLILGLTSSVAVWFLAAQMFTAPVADRATVLFCFFPGSIVFALFYSEALMLTLSAVCLWALLRRNWWLAGVAAAVATATRPNALVLVACCGWAAAGAIRRDREWQSLVAVLLAPVGAAAYIAFLEARTGSATAWFRVENRGWQDGFDFGTATFHRLRLFAAGPGHDIGMLVGAVCFVAVLACLPVVWRARLPAELLIFAAGVLLLAAGSKSLGLRPRFLLSAFPVFIALAAQLPTRVYQILAATMAGLLALLMVLTLKTLYITP